MEILSEWFKKGESDLYLLGFAIIFAMIVLPASKEKYNSNFLLIAITYSVYIICEGVMMIAVPADYSTIFLLLFIGGVTFSIATGRLIKFYLLWIKKQVGAFIYYIKKKKEGTKVKYVEENDEEIDVGQEKE